METFSLSSFPVPDALLVRLPAAHLVAEGHYRSAVDLLRAHVSAAALEHAQLKRSGGDGGADVAEGKSGEDNEAACASMMVAAQQGAVQWCCVCCVCVCVCVWWVG